MEVRSIETIVKALNGADRIMNESIFIGVYPGLTKTILDCEIEMIHEFVADKTV